jgi:tRNA A37 methylthiotransferase MiaB
MLTQQEVAFAKARERIGQRVQVLIDEPAEKVSSQHWIGRLESQAPEIDSHTQVCGPNLHVGQMLAVKITGSDGYDLMAAPARAAASLSVLR